MGLNMDYVSIENFKTIIEFVNKKGAKISNFTTKGSKVSIFQENYCGEIERINFINLFEAMNNVYCRYLLSKQLPDMNLTEKVKFRKKDDYKYPQRI